MELGDFLHSVRQEIFNGHSDRAGTATGIVFSDNLFVKMVTDRLAEAGTALAAQICQYSASVNGEKVRVSGYGMSEDCAQLDFFISVYKDCGEIVAVADDELLSAAEECARFIRWCTDGTLGGIVDESHDAFPLVHTLKDGFSELAQVRMFILTDGTASLVATPELIIRGKPVEISIVDISALHRTVEEAGLRDDFQLLSSFRQDLLESVRSSADSDEDTPENVFAADAGQRLGEAEEIADFQLCRYADADDSGLAIRIDGYAFDDADGSLALIVADFSNADDIQVMDEEAVSSSLAELCRYAEAALAGSLGDRHGTASEAGIGFAAEMATRREGIARIRMYLVTDRLAESAQLPADRPVGGIPADFQVWDVARFHRTHMSESGKDHFDVDFCRAGGRALPALHAGSGSDYEGYLCTIPGAVLAAVYERYGARLLEGNVRSFLSVKGKINAGIQSTIKEKPAMFFAYNNGIAATADEVVLSADGSIEVARNLQIVNGGQTTASLAAAARAGVDLSGVMVQMKLSVLPPQRAGELIPMIARFANSQNKVSESDFFANHPYHLRLEQISRRVSMTGPDGAQTFWFYERSRGQFLNEQRNLDKQGRAAFLLRHPKAQLLTKLDVARLENSFKGLPHKVSLGAQKNFTFFAGWLSKAWTKDDQVFDDGYFRSLAAMAILQQHTEALIARQPWFQGAYRPNILAYTLSLVQFMILQDGKGRQLDLHSIWTTQTVPEALSELLATGAGIAFSVLTASDRPRANVTEWAKAEACWERTRGLAPALPAGVYALLEDPGAARARRADAAVDDRVGYGAFASAAVRGIEPAVWATLHRWGEEHNLINPLESKLLRSATRLPRFVPSVNECEKIWTIRAKLIRSGFVLADSQRYEADPAGGRLG